MAQLSSSSRCLAGTGLFFVLLSLGFGVPPQLLATWLTQSLDVSATLTGTGSSIKITTGLGLWKNCSTVSANTDLVAEIEQCDSHASFIYVRLLSIGALGVGLIAGLVGLGSCGSRACQLICGLLLLVQGCVMCGAIGRFVYVFKTTNPQPLLNGLGVAVANNVDDAILLSLISPATYGLAFELACVSGGAAFFATLMMLIAYCTSGRPQQEGDEIQLVQVIQA